MNIILTYLFYILVFPGILFITLMGLLLQGLDRKLVARMQKRVGPPITQPLYDFFKLMGKETIIPERANKKVFLGAPVVAFISLIITALFIPIFSFSPFGFSADILVILYLLTVPGVCLILGGSASGSPFGGIGASREMVTMMAYELPFILILLTIGKATGGSYLCFSLEQIVAYQEYEGSFITHLSLIPAALAMLLVVPAEIGAQPFDAAEAETEICEGPLVEYSGAPLAMFKLNTSIKMYVMAALFTMLFCGGIYTGNIFLDILVLILICVVVTFLTSTLIHAITARLKIEHLFKFYWTVVAGLALLSMILVWIGL